MPKGGVYSVAPAGAGPPSPPAGNTACQLLRFRGYILGHFNNAAQHARKGDDHPFAEHISDVANQKIVNTPAGFFDDDRFFDLEESYYTTVVNGTAQTMSKPMIFLFHPDKNGSVALTSYVAPKGTNPASLRNNNTALRLDFTKMTLTPDFNTASYKYDPATKSFHLDAVTPIPGGEFKLTETIAANTLTVMEDVIMGGHSVMPYHTPIIYERI